MKTMQEVLAEHEDCAFSASGVLVCVCGVALDPQEVMDDLSNLATHQADMLATAGYGLVADAKREARAQALEEAADHLMRVGWNNACTAHLRARAAAERGGE